MDKKQAKGEITMDRKQTKGTQKTLPLAGYTAAWSTRAVSIAVNFLVLMQITYYSNSPYK